MIFLNEAFKPHSAGGKFYTVTREELREHLDEIWDFLEGNDNFVIFITEDGEYKLALMSAAEYDRLKNRREGND